MRHIRRCATAAILAATIGVGLNLSMARVEATGTIPVRDLSAACSYLKNVINDPAQPAFIVKLATLAFSALGC